ncbi:MAG TPA: ABC transporter permease [Burkholderiales bacterium]|nr:ABC transporter permease [Burkholderiales bacterium]
MVGVYRELEGCMQLFVHVLRRLHVLRLPPVADVLTRQIYFTGASATAGIVLRGAFIGTLIIAYVINVLDADAALAVKILLWVVLREIGPLIAAVLVVQRSGAAVATELALMTVSGQVDSLRQMRVDPHDYLVVPRVIGIALSNAALTVYVQMIAVGGGMLLGPVVIDASFEELADNFFRLATPLDVAYSLIKSLLFGAAIAVIACYHGLNPPGRSFNAVPRAAINAVTQSTLLVMLLNVVFAYVVYGVLFFGLIKAEV